MQSFSFVSLCRTLCTFSSMKYNTNKHLEECYSCWQCLAWRTNDARKLQNLLDPFHTHTQQGSYSEDMFTKLSRSAAFLLPLLCRWGESPWSCNYLSLWMQRGHLYYLYVWFNICMFALFSCLQYSLVLQWNLVNSDLKGLYGKTLGYSFSKITKKHPKLQKEKQKNLPHLHRIISQTILWRPVFKVTE